MSFSQMKHFIHEFCHIIHNTLIESHYPLFGIKELSKDIYDIPCYLMQKIFLEDENLKKITKNYRTNNKLDNETIKKMKLSENIDIAYKTKKEILYSFYDLFVHSKENFCKIMKDNKNALKELYDKYFENVFENQNIIMNKNDEKYPFSHLKNMQGDYYLKLLNDSYACDIYLKSSNKEKLISTIKDIMKCGSKISSSSIIEKYFGCKLDLLSYVKYYNIETNDNEIENYNEISQESNNKVKENINLTSEVPRIDKNEFKEIYTEDSSYSYDNTKIFSKN
jgi:Zn-dependent oligopeptidase